MRKWLATFVSVALVASSAASSQPNRTLQVPSGKPHVASNFMIPPVPQFHSRSLLQDGMIAQEEVAPNAHVGVGLAPMRGRDIHSVMTEKELVPTRNPGVTFVFRFAG